MLSALFWYSPTTGLTPGSASLTSGSSWVNPSSVAINTGDGYGYASSDPTGPHGANQGVSAVGIGFFGDGNFAGYSTPRVHLDGDAYDILPANGISSSGKGFNNKYPLANDSMTFTLTLPTGVTSPDISDVSFQYSSAITGPNVVGNVLFPLLHSSWCPASWAWACWDGGGFGRVNHYSQQQTQPPLTWPCLFCFHGIASNLPLIRPFRIIQIIQIATQYPKIPLIELSPELPGLPHLSSSKSRNPPEFRINKQQFTNLGKRRAL